MRSGDRRSAIRAGLVPGGLNALYQHLDSLPPGDNGHARRILAPAVPGPSATRLAQRLGLALALLVALAGRAAAEGNTCGNDTDCPAGQSCNPGNDPNSMHCESGAAGGCSAAGGRGGSWGTGLGLAFLAVARRRRAAPRKEAA